jgi:hypothetical protein
MAEPHRFREIESERIILREPDGGRIRAVLETGPPRGPDAETPVPVVRLTLLGPTGAPALVAEVDEAGQATLSIGPPDRGTAVVITPAAVDLWTAGNVVATLRSTLAGGVLDLGDPAGALQVSLPAP